MKELLHQIKYEHQYHALLQIGRHLKSIHKDLINQLTEVKYWVPIPYHSKRLNQRGYNIVEELFSPLLSTLHIQKAPIIKRKKNTSALFNKSLKHRKIILKDIFEISKEDCSTLADSTLVLVDDIVSSQSTFKEIIQEIESLNKNISIKCLSLAKVV
ncbi:hypothetical protein DID78_06060 [Candidatus Marinamargulisbacteria bacterium SCGC AG-343-D04]|nr:hypothetical protein DID78_06060 [Candidatus Marinamargulisbacteria bacterium SCGC AG-343-D04]